MLINVYVHNRYLGIRLFWLCIAPIILTLLQITLLFNIPESFRWLLAHKTPAGIVSHSYCHMFTCMLYHYYPILVFTLCYASNVMAPPCQLYSCKFACSHSICCIECLESMRHIRRSSEVSSEFNCIYRALSADARLVYITV